MLENLEWPMVIPVAMDALSRVQSMARQKREGAKMQPCLTPDLVGKHSDVFLP